MFENKAFKIEIIEKTTDQETITKPVNDEVKELIVYTVKAVGFLIVVGFAASTISQLIVNHV
jgi:hypothetical protein